MSINVTLNGIDSPNQTNFYGTVGTSALQIIGSLVRAVPSQLALQFLQIHNPSNENFLAYTTDGTDPVINGRGVTLGPNVTATYDIKVPQGPIKLVGDGSACPYTIITF